jgi:alpha-ribazole phosphatase
MNEPTNQRRLRLYLIRHGEVEGAGEGRLLGRTDTPLSEHGLEQTRRMAERLSTAQLSAIHSSDLRRASVTAEIIATRSDLKVQASSAWREIDMGEWEGQTLEALHRVAPQLVEQLFADPALFKYPHGESFVHFTARVLGALDQLLASRDGDDVALIAHGGVCRAIIGSALGMPMKNWLCLAQDYGCLNVIDWYDGRPLLVSLNSGSSDEELH